MAKTEKLLFLGGRLHGKLRGVPFGATEFSVANRRKVQQQGCMAQAYYRSQIRIENSSRDVMVRCGGTRSLTDLLFDVMGLPTQHPLRKADLS